MGEMDEKYQQMLKELENLPPDQRKMMEGMMGGLIGEGKGEYDLRRTGTKRTIAGYSCEQVLLEEGGTSRGEFWVTKDLGSMREYAENWPELWGKFVRGSAAKKMSKLAELDGFAMEINLDDMKSVVTKLEKRNVSDSEFEVPAGYKKVKSESGR